MTPATAHSNNVQPSNVHQFAKTISCQHCLSFVESAAKFCGNCGVVTQRLGQAVQPPSVQRNVSVTGASALQPSENSLPKFATPITGKRAPVPPQLRDELTLLMTMLLRERIFLIGHCGLFLTANFIGFGLAIQAYTGFIGDEMTKLVISLTPLMFINSLALVCLVPINGTKREIARVKEKIQYARFRIEYFNQI